MHPFFRHIQLFSKIIGPRIHNPVKVGIFGNVVFIVLFNLDFSGGEPVDCFPLGNIPHIGQIFFRNVKGITHGGGVPRCVPGVAIDTIKGVPKVEGIQPISGPQAVHCGKVEQAAHGIFHALAEFIPHIKGGSILEAAQMKIFRILLFHDFFTLAKGGIHPTAQAVTPALDGTGKVRTEDSINGRSQSLKDGKNRRDHDQLVELLLDFLDNSTVYCRENVLRALCAMGSAPALEHALARFHEQGWYHQPRLISDGLTAFAGDRAALARRLWDAGAAWDENLRIGIIQFASNLSESFADLFLPALTQKETSSETRFALIRYFQRKPTPAARPILFELALTGKDEGGPAIAACAALARYPGPDTEQVLEDALLSRNWYVRRNAAASLSALGVEAETLTKPRQSGDRYAVEMLTYMAGIRKSREKVNG